MKNSEHKIESPTECNSIVFSISKEDPSEILKLTKKGMYYKGKFISDAGEAHVAFMKTMEIMQQSVNKDNYLDKDHEKF